MAEMPRRPFRALRPSFTASSGQFGRILTTRGLMAAKKLQAHHDAWLRAHPDRNEGWLLDMLREGFDVHHVDGDHDNNTPLNLVLIEAVDHMRLHGMNLKDGQVGWRRKLQEKSTQARAEKVASKARAAAQAAPPTLVTLPMAEREVTADACWPLHSGLAEMDVKAYQSRVNRGAACTHLS